MAGEELMSAGELAGLNASRSIAYDDLAEGCADTPLLGKVLKDQMESAEREFLSALVRLQLKYAHAHELRRLSRRAAADAVKDLLEESGINNAGA